MIVHVEYNINDEISFSKYSEIIFLILSLSLSANILKTPEWKKRKINSENII